MKRLKSFLTLIFLTLLTVIASGCPSTATMHTARPIEPGTMEFTVSPMVHGIYFETEEDDLFNDQVNLVGAGVLGQFRYGIAETMDFGIKMDTYLQTRFDFNWAPVLLENFVLSLNPSFSFSFFSNGAVTAFTAYGDLGVLADVVSTENVSLTLAAKPGFLASTAPINFDVDDDEPSSASNAIFTIGGSLGAKFQVSDRLALLPEFSFMHYPTIEARILLYAFNFGFVF